MGRSVPPVDALPASPADADMAAARVKPAAPGATCAGVVPGERVLECRTGMFRY